MRANVQAGQIRTMSPEIDYVVLAHVEDKQGDSVWKVLVLDDDAEIVEWLEVVMECDSLVSSLW